jgi:hypothetical protein
MHRVRYPSIHHSKVDRLLRPAELGFVNSKTEGMSFPKIDLDLCLFSSSANTVFTNASVAKRKQKTIASSFGLHTHVGAKDKQD